ncbi:pyridoxal phosphate-dependent decarboxylase family protein [Granulosicoccus antarcticus]|uniref:L-2,4-diaminobutyrate decarboxylase n=1 Tax=Granulosicoccus antarcticus IMCC3135 TaxID=1192854 RepID=A0A2Z2P1V7_9GAMM|nr:pyridoxal-dependent decarboxylase [Granulosicoccus antarcticus]ASJ76228.1 L-2,4-diaminobutyrate decarboxylase [Granulosicoccus antarcticus IMCC3135]
MQDYLDVLTRAVQEWVPEDRPTSQAPSAAELKQILDVSLADEGSDMQSLEDAVKAYLHYNPAVYKSDFYKLLYSGQNKPALLGDWITSLSNATMHTYQVGPVATLMELELIHQWNRLVGFDKDGNQPEGVMVAGGSQANLIGMMLARHHACPDLKSQGPSGRTLVAYVSDQAHYSGQKAANVLGIGTDNLIAVASDDQGRICPVALQQEIDNSLSKGHLPFYIGLTAGTTVTGAYDPVAPCSEIARKHNIWLHIDGAWGGPILFSEQHRHLLADSHLADSFTWDAHKLMNVPITAAVILVKQAGALKSCCSGGGGEYLFHADENADYNLGERSIQCGRRADALKVWLSWKAIGNQGFAAKIDQLQTMKSTCVELINNSDTLEMLAPAAYVNILFRYRPETMTDEAELKALNIGICKAMMNNGGPYVDYAQYKGRYGIRLILANDEVDEAQLAALLELCQQTGRELVDKKSDC